MPLYFDSHMHTSLCKHAWGEPEEYAARAVEVGLKGITFTCHSPMPSGFWPHVRMSDSEFDDYVTLVERCRLRFEGILDVRLGLESDFFPGLEDWSKELHGRADFHYILGSVHWQGPEYRAKFDDQDELAFRKSYFENLAASAETGLFDCLSHPDLIKNYLPGNWYFEDWQDSIANALDRIAKTGVAMELNTSGIYKSYEEMNPSPSMLKMMAERDIPIVIGSDSHKAHRVGENFKASLQTLQHAGFINVSVFQNRQRSELSIAEVLESLI